MLNNTAGSNNIALGYLAGQNVTGNNNIDIGNVGAAESNTIRIGTHGTQTATIASISGTVVTGSDVVVSSTGRLGIVMSSARYKHAIHVLIAAAEASCGLSFAAGVGGVGAVVSAAAHPWQNLAVGRLVAPQPGHCTTSGAEHSSQNRALSWFSEPQSEQRTNCLSLAGISIQ
jgi:hypothetical protein